MGKRLHIQLLGNFSLKSGNRSITTINTPRLQAFLAFLLLNHKSPQPRRTLAYLFWPDSNDVQARTNLRNLIHLLGQTLPDADRFLRKDTHSLQWSLGAPCELDVDRFEKAITQAKQMQAVGEISGTLSKLEYGITIYRGDLLPNCYADWILPERERLRQMFTEALEQVIQLLEDRHDYQNAIHYAQELLRYDPLYESSHRRLMRLHALNGNRAAALRVYLQCVTLLRRELNVEPSANTLQLYEDLVGNRQELAPSSRAVSMNIEAPMV